MTLRENDRRNAPAARKTHPHRLTPLRWFFVSLLPSCLSVFLFQAEGRIAAADSACSAADVRLAELKSAIAAAQAQRTQSNKRTEDINKLQQLK